MWHGDWDLGDRRQKANRQELNKPQRKKHRDEKTTDPEPPQLTEHFAHIELTYHTGDKEMGQKQNKTSKITIINVQIL